MEGCADLARRLEGNRRAIEEALRTFVAGEHTSFQEDVAYVLEGGKKLRGSLAMLVNEELGGPRDRGLLAALALEVAHAGSLALDDIVDMDLERRGRPSAWRTIGVGKAALVANLLGSRAVQLTLPLGRVAIEEVLSAWHDLTLGELLDAYVSEADYETVVGLKTSRLFEVALALGAVSSGRHDLVEGLKAYGRELGKLYQLLDDLADVIGRGEGPPPTARRLCVWLGVERECGDTAALRAKAKEKVLELLRAVVKRARGIEHEGLKHALLCLPLYVVSLLAERELRECLVSGDLFLASQFLGT